MGVEKPEIIDENLLNAFMGSLALAELRERFKIKPEDFKTKLDLQCYLIALQITATDKDFLIPISGKPKMGKSTLGIQIGIKTKEALRKGFHVEIPEFSVETDIHYPPISEKELMKVIDNEKPPMKMFDRVVFDDATLSGIGFDKSEIEDLEEGVCVYFSNMKMRKRGYNKFENDVKNIFEKSFIYDLIFTNPLMPDKDYKEFCDILITFFDSALVIQCKESAIEDPEGLTKSTIVYGLNQLKTSMNRARARSEKLFIVNSIKIFKDYNFFDIKKFYPILVVNRKLPFLDYNAINNIPEIKKLDFVPIILSIEDLKFLVSELNTPSDLFAYFDEREMFIKNETTPFADEKELLSYYLLNNKSFESRYVDSRYNILLGFHEEYKNGKLSELFAKKKELDKISYWVDDILQNSHLSYESNYLRGIEELFKLNRMQRRQLATRAEEKRHKAIEKGDDFWGAWGLTTFKENLDVSFVTYFTSKLDDKAKEFFKAMCATAQYKTKAKKIVGIAQNTGIPKITMGMYFEPLDPPTLEEEVALKNTAAGFWDIESTSDYWEFKK